MAELDLTNIAGSSISTPSSGVSAVYVDSTSKLLTTKIDTGAIQSGPGFYGHNQSVTTPAAAFAADTYLVGSNVTMPTGFPRVGTAYRLIFDVTKTGAGTATPIFIVRYGTAGSVADTARLTFTFAAGTAAIDTGTVEIFTHFRTVGASTNAVLVGAAKLDHHLAVTGLTTTGASGNGIILAVSAGFDSTPAGSIIGTSVNGGTSAAWTITMVRAEVIGN